MRYLLILLSVLCLSSSIQAQSSYRNRTPAERYLLSALDFVSRYSYYQDRIDWDTHYEAMLAELSEAEPDDVTAAYPLIRETLDQLGDAHGLFVSPEQYEANFGSSRSGAGFRLTADDVVYLVYPDSPAAEAGVATGDQLLERTPATDDSPATYTFRRPNDTTRTITIEPDVFENILWTDNTPVLFRGCVAYIESHQMYSPEKQAAYVTHLWQTIRQLQQSAEVCGWIVDVRRNGGGYIKPILLGIAPLAGERALLKDISPHIEQLWLYNNEGLYIENQIQLGAPAGQDAPDVDMTLPLVVLAGSETASAGEMVVMALRERPGTHVIGEPTYGAATRGLSYQMNDGAMLFITTARLADPDGNLYDLRLKPDEVVPVQWEAFATENDPAVQAALDWIEAARTD